MTVRERQASVRARRKKRGRRLMIAYALRGVIFLLLDLMIILMVCGVLYIREHLAPAPDSELPDGNMEPDDSALSELPIVPIEPAIPGEITIPDWIVQDILPVNEYSRPGIALSEVNGAAVHYTGNPGTTAEQNRSYYKNLAETKETYATAFFQNIRQAHRAAASAKRCSKGLSVCIYYLRRKS